MKNLFIIAAFILVFAAPVSAHPASRVELSVEGQVLKVTAVHNVGDPKNHYIDDITVTVNGKQMVVQDFLTQTDYESQSVSYTIPSLKNGDLIVVDTDCSRGGRKKGELTVGAETEALP